MASNIAHPFLWNILGYFVFNFLCSTKQKTGRMFTHKHKTSGSTIHLAEWAAMDKHDNKKYFIYTRQNFYLMSKNLNFNKL